MSQLRREYSSGSSVLSRLGDVNPPRNPRASQALAKAIHGASLVLSVGGGPMKPDPRFVNLNLEPFPNVDLVADAHCLPVRSAAIQVVHSEAVLEHLEQPELAVREMYRVLRPGGFAFAATPFLQVFHGYPNHFQNFTVEGHAALFRRVGFEVVEAGPCIGPTFALVDLASNWARYYLPTRFLSRSCSYAIRLVGRVMVRFDRILFDSPAGHLLPSTTYVLARKPD